MAEVDEERATAGASEVDQTEVTSDESQAEVEDATFRARLQRTPLKKSAQGAVDAAEGRAAADDEAAQEVCP